MKIRHLWLSEKVTEREVALEHMGTQDMFTNILTKPVQGAQFERKARIDQLDDLKEITLSLGVRWRL